MYVLGIDPGFSGGLAIVQKIENLPKFAKTTSVLNPSTRLVATLKTPKRRVNGSNKLIPEEIMEFLRKYPIDFACIEDVGAMPGQGVVSMFTFGYVTGHVTGLVTSQKIKIVRASPSVWKASMGLSRDKEASVRFANQIYGTDFKYRDEGIAEAALLAHFGFTYFGSKMARRKELSVFD